MLKISVPATSANLGPGFDSMGLALDWRLEVTIIEPSAQWEVIHPYGPEIPTDENNYIVNKALTVQSDLAPHRIEVKSTIPLERGLGSSSAALIAGIELANQIGQLKLTSDEKLLLAATMEGHPDNVAPALLGGGVAAYYNPSDKQVWHAPVNLPFETHQAVVFVPNYHMVTNEVRKALPAELPFRTAVEGSAISNVLIATLNQGRWNTALKMMELDKFHEISRAPLMPELHKIRTVTHDLGLAGTYLSGAGPTILTLVPNERVDAFYQAVAALNLNGEIKVLALSQQGLLVEHD
ncbi:MAG: homoserine kinase [Lactobacillaceae bacterium]|jgi:homoserine kinase|nr:homoserine kinase [Lactobacillaceae bacterium]